MGYSESRTLRRDAKGVHRYDQNESRGVWDASECALLLIDYQDHSLDVILAPDLTLGTSSRPFTPLGLGP